jgi:hypothetical protein
VHVIGDSLQSIIRNPLAVVLSHVLSIGGVAHDEVHGGRIFDLVRDREE